MKEFRGRRAHIRRKAYIPLKVRSIVGKGQKPRDWGSSRFVGNDVSAGGLGVETLMPLEIDDLMELDLLLPGSSPIPVIAIVRNVRAEKRGKYAVYLVGLEYVQISAANRKRIMRYVSELGFLV